MKYWKHLDEVEGYSPPGHEGTFNRTLVGKEEGIQGVEMIYGEMEEGGLADPHYHADIEQVMYVLNGEMEIDIEGKVTQLSKGHVVWIPQMATHEVKNIGNSKLSFILIYSPPKNNT